MVAEQKETIRILEEALLSSNERNSNLFDTLWEAETTQSKLISEFNGLKING